MGSDEFILKAKELVRDYANEHIDITDNYQITLKEVYVTWFGYVRGNQKALVSTKLHDGMYYEITYNPVDNEIYFDAYKKFENRCIKMGE